MFPVLFRDNSLSGWMDLPFRGFPAELDRRLWGARLTGLMKSDLKENDDGYELCVELPGFRKEDLTLELKDGFLAVTAERNRTDERKDAQGRIVHQERYAGSMSRRFYVGETITEEDVKARFEDGVLRLAFPKEEKKLPERRLIPIEE